jgi:hypothetical protein
MTVAMILLPLFVLVLLTFVLGFWTVSARVRVIRSGQVKMRDIALREPNYPPRVTQIGNAYHNQLELPVLFYVLTILTMVTRTADLIFVLLAWVFVVLRLAHAYIHVTSNHVSKRFYPFLASAVVLAMMWLMFMIRVLVG